MSNLFNLTERIIKFLGQHHGQQIQQLGINRTFLAGCLKVLVKPKREVAVPIFIRWVLESELVKDQAHEGTKSIGTPDLGIKIIRDFKIPFPPFKEQKKIAIYLDGISEIIKSLTKLQQKTEDELEKLISLILDKAFRGELIKVSENVGY
jgi:restriction endonuclease S subunit